MNSILDLTSLFSSPVPIYLGQFFLILTCLSALFIVSQSYFSYVFANLVKKYITNNLAGRIVWLLLANISLLVVSAAYFPHSVNLTKWFYLWPEHHPNINLLWLVFFIPALFYIFKRFNSNLMKTILGLGLIAVFSFHLTSEPENMVKTNRSNQPNIILIGVDSLRGDILESHMPFLTGQLSKSTVFNTVFSPLGRTFPAWNTILTGLYPTNHGARINLINPDQLIGTQHYLPSILKKEGYRTIFSIDETRFANIGAHQGFDQTITPRMGASDFIISNVADIPIINLLSLSKYSEWLLPEIFSNRGAAKTYRPSSFNELIERNLPIADQPTFLAVHFCLPHWPYIFSSKALPKKDYSVPYYPLNINAVDQQIKTLFKTLEKKGYLQNSRIVFLSDHGEAWAHESPSFTNKNDTNQTHHIEEYGHGSSVLSHSNQVLLALKNFKNEIALSANIDKSASLADITPTILDELNITPKTKIDGENLASTNLYPNRIFPLETGTVLTLNEKDKLDIDQIVNKFINRYEMQPNGLITIQDTKIKEGLEAKEYAIRSKQQILQKMKPTGFRLFDLTSNEYIEYQSLTDLENNAPIWKQAWCHYYIDKCI
ncbi:sulfatase-like hydrolase/transferase [Oceaniserpentilla sp. 4NH20-0058]|uniref:sulfatase-like hydrolase/transferase n=1 Tax=Oceaniserpentilla sp. 4NH20-0058 TaxID=3127660 RepID=UPI00333E486B